jgi:hypothetical protein
MVARRIAGALPPWTAEEQREAAKIRSACGLGDGATQQRPFRAPHHTLSLAAMVGGGNPIRPGEISLAHGGVMFLDELLELPARVVEGAARALRTGTASVAIRRDVVVRFPAAPAVVVATAWLPWLDGPRMPLRPRRHNPLRTTHRARCRAARLDAHRDARSRPARALCARKWCNHMMPDGYAMKLTQEQLDTAINALRVAVLVYDSDVLTFRRLADSATGDEAIGHGRVADQFAKQACEARQLVDEMELRQ